MRSSWSSLHLPIACFLALGLGALSFNGCDSGSSDTIRNVSIDFSGFYDGADGGYFVEPPNSGHRVTSMNLFQTGDQLEAIDNCGLIWRGTIGNINDDTKVATFEMEGQTTAGQPVTIAGTLTGSGDTGEMRAQWIEPNVLAVVNGDAIINPVPTNTAITISPVSATIYTNGATQQFVANGGSGSYTWSVSASSGSLSRQHPDQRDGH